MTGTAGNPTPTTPIANRNPAAFPASGWSARAASAAVLISALPGFEQCCGSGKDDEIHHDVGKPATALFPVVLLVLIRIAGGLGVGSILLLLLGTQWCVLFNVIAGAIAIPTDLTGAAEVFRFTTADRWRTLILPGIFPSLSRDGIGYSRFKGQTIPTVGLGATISRATNSGNFPLLLAATITMAAIVVTVNRTVWRPMYRLAESRFRLEA